MKGKITVALAGNPNSGKSTIFNLLTGAHQHIGNYPGVTVEKKEGTCKHQNHELLITDLPGTYSLTARSAEEVVARDFLIHEQPQVVVDIVDASNLERNLLLATQIMEMNTSLIIVLNMMDMVTKQKLAIDIKAMEKMLGVPIIPMVGNKGKGKEELLQMIIDVAGKQRKSVPRPIPYSVES